MPELGYGIIGCGVIAPFHLLGVNKAKGAKMVAVCDIIPEKAEKFAKDNNIPAWYTDYKELLKRPDIDIVSICTPSGLHSEIAIEAAKAGKHILCEKPIDITLPAIDKMLDVVEQKNVKLGVMFQRRTYETSQQVRQTVQSGGLGKMVLGDAYLKYYRSQAYYDSAGWRGTWELDGGGALMNQGVHGIDLLLWIMGDVATVYAKADHLVRNIKVEDTAVAVLTYKNGAFGVIEGTTSVYPGEETRLEFHGDLGTIILQEQTIKKWVILGSDGKPQDVTPQGESVKVGGTSDPAAIATLGHERGVQNIIDAVLENKPVYCSGLEARKSVEIILAIYQSVKTKKEIKLPL
ncbi:MAG: Gfo/Idh/MocA family oxidoreductase [bacterium]|nr:Gfo/Idh/MocA family oxidoreductase [bacterium]